MTVSGEFLPESFLFPNGEKVPPSCRLLWQLDV